MVGDRRLVVSGGRNRYQGGKSPWVRELRAGLGMPALMQNRVYPLRVSLYLASRSHFHHLRTLLSRLSL